ncbi:hypothetical protein PIB30_022170 [Stylosanthes scabra]|uniref:Replication factor A C-terminal domain-containing protein n=1 Tax=Stylosanthes scabra TaxID=79078 RepID=A0ABU6W7B5_9FABA|nr:hypothetical protein [Stylosanthes scabra]
MPCNDIHLIDAIGHVVGKEDVSDLVTKAGKESRILTIYMEDLDKNRLKCTLFGSMIRNSMYTSRVFFNPDFPEVGAFRERLAEHLPHLESASDVCDFCPRKVLVNNNRYWCNQCRKGGLNPLIRYCVGVVVADGTGSAKLMLWNREVRLIVGKNPEEVKNDCGQEGGSSHSKVLDEILEKRYLFKLAITEKTIGSVDPVYSVIKPCEDEGVVQEHSSQTSSLDNMGFFDEMGCITVLGASQDNESEVNCITDVNLSKTVTESNGETGLITPTKAIEANFEQTVSVIEISPNAIQHSTNKTFKRGGGKRKLE